MALSTADYAALELQYNAFMAPVYARALASLALPAGSHGLDAGCGPGGLFPHLAQAVRPRGRITGLDVSGPHLAAARRLAAEHGLADRTELVQADLAQSLPFQDGSFDWVWTADVIWPPLFFPDGVPVARELLRVTRPGGTVALFFAAPTRGLFLPGFPDLEHKLCAAATRRDFFGGHTTQGTGRHPEQCAGWLSAAGAEDVTVDAVCAIATQPLSHATRRYIQDFVFDTAYTSNVRVQGNGVPGGLSDEARAAGLTEADLALWQSLAMPGSPEHLLDRPDYYCVAVGVVAAGRKPAA